MAGHRTRISEHEFLQELRDFVADNPGSEAAEMAAKLEMELASPGDWDVARTQPAPVEVEPDTTE